MSEGRRRASEISRATADVVLGRYKRQRLSQADLVDATGISVTTMRRLIAGEAEFDLDQLFAIAEALEASAADILREAEQSVSAGAAIPLSRYPIVRKEAEARSMNPDRLTHMQHAAIADAELDSDETT